ncbi:Signal peptidase complex subunit 1 [Chionoecetes opilio]|uniref:Signal peptidase complex subunit 1 n=1 Tax=Chionoecetes opilio TaxID=41210 RepID=A0A8J5CJ10_CHIOP|nr:Signal peptidase complex subunit 1 [Chionoecetes opilio]
MTGFTDSIDRSTLNDGDVVDSTANDVASTFLDKLVMNAGDVEDGSNGSTSDMLSSLVITVHSLSSHTTTHTSVFKRCLFLSCQSTSGAQQGRVIRRSAGGCGMTSIFRVGRVWYRLAHCPHCVKFAGSRPGEFNAGMPQQEASQIGQRDFEGQKLAERLFQIIVVAFGAVGWLYGYHIQDFFMTVLTLGAGFLLACLKANPLNKGMDLMSRGETPLSQHWERR